MITTHEQGKARRLSTARQTPGTPTAEAADGNLGRGSPTGGCQLLPGQAVRFACALLAACAVTAGLECLGWRDFSLLKVEADGRRIGDLYRRTGSSASTNLGKSRGST